MASGSLYRALFGTYRHVTCWRRVEVLKHDTVIPSSSIQRLKSAPFCLRRWALMLIWVTSWCRAVQRYLSKKLKLHTDSYWFRLIHRVCDIQLVYCSVGLGDCTFFHIFSFSPHPFCTILFWPWSLVAQEFPFKSYPLYKRQEKREKKGKRYEKFSKQSALELLLQSDVEPGCQRFHPEDESSETSTYEPCTTRTFGQGIRWAAWQAGFGSVEFCVKFASSGHSVLQRQDRLGAWFASGGPHARPTDLPIEVTRSTSSSKVQRCSGAACRRFVKKESEENIGLVDRRKIYLEKCEVKTLDPIDPLQIYRPVETGVSFCLLRLHDIFGAKRRKAPPPPEFAKVVPVQTADVPKVKAWVFRWNWT